MLNVSTTKKLSTILYLQFPKGEFIPKDCNLLGRRVPLLVGFIYYKHRSLGETPEYGRLITMMLHHLKDDVLNDLHSTISILHLVGHNSLLVAF